jgi:hypothetical protein
LKLDELVSKPGQVRCRMVLAREIPFLYNAVLLVGLPLATGCYHPS